MSLVNALLTVAALFLPAASAAAEPLSRRFEATYVGVVENVPAGLSRLEVWVPIPQDSAFQRISNVKVDSPYPGTLRREKEFGNSYYYFSTDEPKSGKLEVRVHFEAERREIVGAALSRASGESPENLRRFLQEVGYDDGETARRQTGGQIEHRRADVRTPRGRQFLKG